MAEVWQSSRDFHRQHNSKTHCDKVNAKARRKLSLINKISSKIWGGSTGDMIAACILTYGSSVSRGILSKLQLTVKLMARIITDTFRATKSSSLLLEANLHRFDRYVDDYSIAAVE